MKINEDKLLAEFFKPERWVDAINSADLKGINKSELRFLCSPEVRSALYDAINTDNYEIAPPHEAQIPKDDGTFRIVYVNEGIDRVVLAIINNMLMDLCGDMIDPSCKSYQRGISTNKVVKEVTRTTRHFSGHRAIGFKADLSKYFDSVPIEFIDAVFDAIEKRFGKSKIINVLRKYYHSDLCFDIDKNLIYHYSSLKQGCAVAAFLADVVLSHIDRKLKKLRGYYIRYSDDILFIGQDFKPAKEMLERELALMSMKLNPRKVETIWADRWFKFLGFSIKGDLISLSQSRKKQFQHEIESRTIRKPNVTLKQAVNSVNRYLYYGDGTYSWATLVLGTINADEDIKAMNNFVLDALRAVQRSTDKREIGGIGHMVDSPDRTIPRRIGRNVGRNIELTEKIIDGYLPLGKARKALIAGKPVYSTLVRQLFA